MSKGQTLRALVNERLTAAAEEIFVLFEKTLAEYEEELCRCKQENQQLQSTRVLLHREGAPVQTSSTCPPVPISSQQISESQIKVEPEEPSLKQEDKELAVCVQEFSAIGVKSEEESALLEQRQNEQREDISSELHFHSQIKQDTKDSSERDNDDDWKPGSILSAEQMETEIGRDQTRDGSSTLTSQNKSAPEMSAVNNGDMSRTIEGAKKHQCSVCQKRFTTFLGLQRHVRIHTGEVPYSCPICMKTFTRKFHLEGHIRTHTSEKPFSCSLCNKTFGRKDCLRNHMRTHTGEKPFHCPTCNKAFADQSNLAVHRRIHTGERPYRCTLCDKSYGHKGCLKSHMSSHTGEKLHCCSLCGKSFGKKAYLDIHMRCHTGEKPYICSICFKAFSVSSNLTRHMRSHEEERRAELHPTI